MRDSALKAVKQEGTATLIKNRLKDPQYHAESVCWVTVGDGVGALSEGKCEPGVGDDDGVAVTSADFLVRVRAHLDAEAPHLRELFDTMAGEAQFARAWLDDDLHRVSGGARLLEVGGGVFLLACMLACEGFRVTTIEPTGIGFGSFEELGSIVLGLAAEEMVEPTVVRCGAESFESELRFDLAFSVNVMEHVVAPDQAAAHVTAALSEGASYRFFCPNYLFPYEPHFNMPTAVGKELTWRLFRRRIESSVAVDDPMGLWRSLNWITVPSFRRMARAQGLDVRFERRTLAWLLERVLSDAQFAGRRAKWMVSLIGAMRRLRLLRFASFIPVSVQPIMDVRLTKRTRSVPDETGDTRSRS